MLACPECGADHNSGWREDAGSPDVPDEEFDYEDFVKREFQGRERGLHPLWWITAVIILAALLVLFFF